MNLKNVILISLILLILSLTAVSAADLKDVNATDSVEPIQPVEPTHTIEPSKAVEHDTNLEPVSKNKTVDLSNTKATSTSPGTFDDLQVEINNADTGSVLVLTRDYNGHYGSRIHLDKDLTIDGQGHTLNCLGEGGCFALFSTSGNILLKNLRIINGHNDYNDKGGAIHIEGSAQYTLENCIFENNFADDYGGAIYNDGKTLTITNCTFKGNKADDYSGGAVYSTKDVIIENSTFTNNEAKAYGGAVCCQGTVTVNANQADRPSTSFFKNNKVKDNYGGAIYAERMNLKNAEFKDNSAYYAGGAVLCNYEFNATNCLFESNEVKNGAGGAVNIMILYSKAYITRCVFKSNSASDSGGAVNQNNGELYIDNSTFENNHAGYKGGAVNAHSIYINTNQPINETFNTFFIGNTVSNSGLGDNDGGAVHTSSGGRIANTYFKNNRAKVNGGAIYVGTYGNINIDHCLFDSNRADDGSYQCHGGAVYAAHDVYIHNCTFKDNYADDYGGAIYAGYVFINNDQGDQDTNTVFIENRAGDNKGGAIYATSDVYSRNAAFINNAALEDGGAIYAVNNVHVVHTVLESNEAKGAKTVRCFGGAIRAEKNAKIENCTFKNNYAENQGGAVYASTVTITGGKSYFEGNTARDYGGAIYTDKFTDDVSYVSFINNKAEKQDGGAVYINGENWITFTQCVFVDNKCGDEGGAIYLDSSKSHLTLKSNIFMDNSAKDGQSVYNCGYYDTISENYWSNNPTTGNDQLIEWKGWPQSNVHHVDTNPLKFVMKLSVSECGVNSTVFATIAFVTGDDIATTLPMYIDYITIPENTEGIEISDRFDGTNGILLTVTPLKEGTYTITAKLFGKTVTATLNVVDGGIVIPEPPVIDTNATIDGKIPKPIITN